jgi:hypothetical protein
MVDYYDRIIVGIAGSVFGGMLLGAVTALGIYTGVFLGALVATAFVYDAMFRHPPLPTTQQRAAAAAIVWHAILLVLAIAVYVG